MEGIQTARRAARAATLAAKPRKNRFKRLDVKVTGSITFLNSVIRILPYGRPPTPATKNGNITSEGA
eukprot:14549266-Heterocapsa_arctica.AAC.1